MSKQEEPLVSFDNISISSKTLTRITGVDVTKSLNFSEIRKNNKQLTEINNDLITGLGYTSFYDLAISTISTEQELTQKGGGKDFGNLTAVEQTVIRNGKPMKMKIYVDKNKQSEDDGESNSLDKGSEKVTARDLRRGYSFPDFGEKADPETIANLSEEVVGWEESKALSSNSANYLEGRDDNGNLRYLVGFSIVGKYLQVDFMISDGTVGGYWTSAFYEALKKAYELKLGVVYPNLNTRALYLLANEYEFELTADNKQLRIEADTLNSLLGSV